MIARSARKIRGAWWAAALFLAGGPRSAAASAVDTVMTAAPVPAVAAAPAGPAPSIADRFASPGAFARTYPGHVARVVAPLGNLRRDGLAVAATGALYLAARAVDHPVARWVEDGHRIGGGLDEFGSDQLPTLLMAAYVVGGAGAPLLRGDGRLAASRVEALVEVVAAQAVIIEGAKHIVNRRRPNGGRFGFPSGHTGVAFATAGLADATLGRGAGIPAYAGAAFVGLTRVTLNRHWVSDVVAGAAIGAAVGELVGRAHRAEERRISLHPTSTGDPGLELRVRIGPSGRDP